MFPSLFFSHGCFLTHLLTPGFAQAGSAAAEELPGGGKRLCFSRILSRLPVHHAFFLFS